MNFWKIKRGNSSIQEIPIYNSRGFLIEDLDDVSTATFVIKEKRDDDTALVTKTKGAGIQLDEPSPGYVKITLDPADTNLWPKKYFMALELLWLSGLKYEVIFKIDGQETEMMEILPQIIT